MPNGMNLPPSSLKELAKELHVPQTTGVDVAPMMLISILNRWPKTRPIMAMIGPITGIPAGLSMRSFMTDASTVLVRSRPNSLAYDTTSLMYPVVLQRHEPDQCALGDSCGAVPVSISPIADASSSFCPADAMAGPLGQVPAAQR